MSSGSADLPSIPGNWNLIFIDTFQSTTLDTNKWSTCYWWSTDGGCTNAGNSELEWYQPDNVIPTLGGLRLKAEKRTVNHYNYVSGMTTTFGKFSFQYGYMEAKMKIPTGKGLWPAFWALPTVENMWPPELDTMEILGHQPNVNNMTLHWAVNGASGQDGSEWAGPDFSLDYHTYGLDWEPSALTWYVDGSPRKVFTDSTKIPALPMYLLANLAVGGTWPGSPDSTTVFPNYVDIQYIKVWQLTAGATPSPLSTIRPTNTLLPSPTPTSTVIPPTSTSTPVKAMRTTAPLPATPFPGTPPSITSGLKLQSMTTATDVATSQTKILVKIINLSGSTVRLSEVKIRYYFTTDTASAFTFNCDYALFGCSNLSASFIQVNPALPGADYYMEMSFSSMAGSIGSGYTSGPIQVRFNKNTWANFNQANDYSFGASNTTFADWNRVTLYRNGALIWGVEPSNAAPKATGTPAEAPTFQPKR
jgi:beta-glucanase (GH16 family)